MARLPARHARRRARSSRSRAGDLRDDLRRRFAELSADPDDHAELVYAEVVAEALAACGCSPGPDLVRAAIEAEHRGWASARHLHPEAHWLLEEVRSRGLRIGIVSNTFDPPDLLHADLVSDGVAERVDAIVFSSEVGRAKAGAAASTGRCSTSWVSSRQTRSSSATGCVRTCRARPPLGMRTCLVTYFRVDHGDHGLADSVATSPAEVLAAVDRIMAAASAG